MRPSVGEYVRREYEWNADKTEATVRKVHTNTVENVFSVFKRGMRGVYRHCDEKHLHRYLAEFDFRYDNRSALGVGDKSPTAVIAGAAGKRLTHRQPQ